jgi:hypothetical protein
MGTHGDMPDWSFYGDRDATPGIPFPGDVPEPDTPMLVESEDPDRESQQMLDKLKAKGAYKQYKIPAYNGIQISRELTQPHVNDNLVIRGRDLSNMVIMLFGGGSNDEKRYGLQVKSDVPNIPDITAIAPVELCTMIVVPIPEKPDVHGIVFIIPVLIAGGSFQVELRWPLGKDQFRRFNKLTEEWFGNYRRDNEQAATRKPVETSAGESKLLRDEGRREKLLARLARREKKQRK